MTKVGLRRADQERALGAAPLGVHRGGGGEFDGVADGCSRPVCLHVVHGRRINAGPGQGFQEDLALGEVVRHRVGRAGAVVVDRRAAKHTPHAVTIGNRVTQPLQHDNATAFASDPPVRGRVERLALAVRGEDPRGREPLEAARVEDDVDTRRQGQVHLAVLQRRRRLMRGDQRRGAGSVQRQRRAFEAELEAHPAADAVEVGAAVGIQADRSLDSALRPLDGAQDDLAVLHVGDAGVHTGASAPQSVRVQPGVLQRPPYRFQHQPMLWIDNLCLERRHAEEGRIEQVDVVEEATKSAEIPSPCVVFEDLADTSDSGTGNGLRDRVSALLEQLPVRVEVWRAGEAAGHADDRERLGHASSHAVGRVRRGSGFALHAHRWDPFRPFATERRRLVR